MNNLRQIYRADELTYGKISVPGSEEQLLPVLVVEAKLLATEGLAAIRMQGFANQEAVEKTFDTGLVTFWSRSQGGLWTKGETSGNTLQLNAAYTDCDADSLLVDVLANGPTCHTGAGSCFALPDIGQ